jgi:hypothetical protein
VRGRGSVKRTVAVAGLAAISNETNLPIFLIGSQGLETRLPTISVTVGVRKGEALALTWDDIHCLRSAEVTVHRHATSAMGASGSS